MKPLALNLSKMKKVGGDAHHSVFQHPQGHQIKIAHGALSPLQRKQIEKMPLHLADGWAPSAYDLAKGIDPDAEPQQDSGKSIFEPGSALPEQYGPPTPSPGLPGLTSVSEEPKDDSKDRAIDSVQPAQSPAANYAQAQAQPAPASAVDSSMDLSGAYKQGLRGIQEQQKVLEQESAANAKRYEEDIQHRNDMMEDAKRNLSEYESHAQQFMNDYANNHINPNAYIENMGAGQKIATAIGLLLGGASSGVTGKNPASDFLDQQIERNIDAQKNRQGQQKTLIEANRQLYGDQQIAENQTRINMKDMLAHQIQLEAAKLGTPQAKAAADQASAQFKMQNIPLIQQNAIKTTVLKNLQQTGGRGINALDLAHAGIMKPEEAEKEQASIDAQNKALSSAKDIFKKYNQEQTAGNILNPESSRRVSAINAELTNLIMESDASKRLTPESAKIEVQPFWVKTSDDDQTRSSKLSGIANLIRQHAAPTPNMTRYAPGSLPNYGIAVSNPMEGKTASDSKGNRIIMQNGRWVKYGG